MCIESKLVTKSMPLLFIQQEELFTQAQKDEAH